jgi:hypothetical protein
MTDPSIQDAMTVQGAAGLAKMAPGLVARGVGAGLEAISPNILPSIQETANSQLLKSMGTGAKEIRGLMGDKGLIEGPKAVEDAANVARKAGLDDLISTGMGRRKALADYIEQQGKNIGGLREEAGTASPGLLDTVEGAVKPKYNSPKPDAFSGEAPDVSIARNTIENIAGKAPPVGPPEELTNAGIAKGITGLNKYAAGNRVNLPKNALTDFAGKASAANDAEIVQKLGADKGLQYSDALANESGAFHLEPAMARGFQRETVSRGGLNPLTAMAQKVADLGGNRLASKSLNAVNGALTNTGTVESVINTLKNSPQTLGKYAIPLGQALQTGGNEGVAAMHYVLSSTHPDYNAMTQEQP